MANINQIWQECSLDGPFQKLCFLAGHAHQDGQLLLKIAKFFKWL